MSETDEPAGDPPTSPKYRRRGSRGMMTKARPNFQPPPPPPKSTEETTAVDKEKISKESAKNKSPINPFNDEATEALDKFDIGPTTGANTSNQAGEFPRTRSQTTGASASSSAHRFRSNTQVLIRQGKIVEEVDPLVDLSMEQRLTLLMAVKDRALTQDEAFEIGKQIVEATQNGKTELVKQILVDISERKAKVQEIEANKPPPKDTSNHFSPDVLSKLDDEQRKGVLLAVASGSLNAEEALDLVAAFVKVEMGLDNAGRRLSQIVDPEGDETTTTKEDDKCLDNGAKGDEQKTTTAAAVVYTANDAKKEKKKKDKDINATPDPRGEDTNTQQRKESPIIHVNPGNPFAVPDAVVAPPRRKKKNNCAPTSAAPNPFALSPKVASPTEKQQKRKSNNPFEVAEGNSGDGSESGLNVVNPFG